MISIFDEIPKTLKPRTIEATASSFCNWVYSQSITSIDKDRESNEKLLNEGRIFHQTIDDFFRSKWVTNNINPGEINDWDTIYADRENEASPILYSSKLKINNESLRCKPDIVLRNKNTQQLIIIERKTTHMLEHYYTNDFVNKIHEGWPNLACQLWCYSWIDDWADMEDIILIGQIWRIYSERLEIFNDHPYFAKSNKQFQRQCTKWFQLYGGIIN